MERAVAIKKLGKLLGKELGYRVDNKAPTAEQRLGALSALAPAIEKRNKLREQRDARCAAILAADTEYQNLVDAARDASKRVDEFSSITRRYKITVGVSTDMFFHIKAQGDSWEEVIDKLTAKEVAQEKDQW